MFLAAAAGDSVGYAIGKKAGPHVFNKEESFLFKRENIHKAEKFYDKYGGKAIVLARFVPIVRTFAPVVAGVGKMKYKHFVAFNLIGAALWSGIVMYAGYFMGAGLSAAGINIDIVILPIIAMIIVLSLIPAAYQILKTKERRQNVWNTFKKAPTIVKDKLKKHKK